MVNKLYVLVRGDLSKSQQAVQACHAVAEFMLSSKLELWCNETIVLLKVKDMTDLLIWRERIRAKRQLFCEFREPDIGNEATAIAAHGDELPELLARLPLL